jgi:hypothetical protein
MTDSLHGFCRHMVYFISLRCPQRSCLRPGKRTRKVTAFSDHFLDSQSSIIAKDWSCIQHVFETPRGVFMGQRFLHDLIDALGSWNWGIV